MKLLGAALSPYVRKVMVYCAERDLTYDHTPIFPMGPEGQEPEFQEASPFGKIPAMNDDGFTLADSSAIVHYLEAKHGTALIPEGAQERGSAIFFDEIADTVMVSAIGTIFFNRVVAPKFMGREGDAEAADAAEKNDLPALLAKLEGLVFGEYLVGDGLTIADISVASAFVNLKHAGIEVDAGAYPALAKWLSGIWARPSFTAQMAMEAKMMG